jgi:hypothetical protein
LKPQWRRDLDGWEVVGLHWEHAGLLDEVYRLQSGLTGLDAAGTVIKR